MIKNPIIIVKTNGHTYIITSVMFNLVMALDTNRLTLKRGFTTHVANAVIIVNINVLDRFLF